MAILDDLPLPLSITVTKIYHLLVENIMPNSRSDAMKPIVYQPLLNENQSRLGFLRANDSAQSKLLDYQITNNNSQFKNHKK